MNGGIDNVQAWGGSTMRRSMVGAGKNDREIAVPKVAALGLGDCACKVSYKIGLISFDQQDHGLKLRP